MMHYNINRDIYDTDDEEHEYILNRIDDFYGEEYLEEIEFIELYERFMKELKV